MEQSTLSGSPIACYGRNIPYIEDLKAPILGNFHIILHCTIFGLVQFSVVCVVLESVPESDLVLLQLKLLNIQGACQTELPNLDCQTLNSYLNWEQIKASIEAFIKTTPGIVGNCLPTYTCYMTDVHKNAWQETEKSFDTVTQTQFGCFSKICHVLWYCFCEVFPY